MQIYKIKGSFADLLRKMKEETMKNNMDERHMFKMVLDGTEAFLKYSELAQRTQSENYDGVKLAYHEMTMECPSSGPGCETCYACTKFLEQHTHIWDFAENEAPDGDPPQACIGTTLRTLSEDPSSADKLSELYTLLVVTFDGVGGVGEPAE